jgi:hypothetical protein
VSKIFYIFILLIILGHSSCSLTNRLSTDEKKVLHIIKDKDRSNLLPYYSFENMKVNLEGNLAVSGKGKLYIKRDDFIFFTVQFMGLEIIRTMITQDSLYYINRLERKYLFVSIKDLQKKYTKYVNYELAQNMAVKGLPIPGGLNSRHLLRFINIADDQYIFNLSGEGKAVSFYYDKDLQIKELRFSDTESGTQVNTTIEYSLDYIEKILADGVLGGSRLKAFIEFGVLSFEEIGRPSMNVNRTYSEINF